MKNDGLDKITAVKGNILIFYNFINMNLKILTEI